MTFFIFLQILGVNDLLGQVKVQVVSQNINKTIDWKPGMAFQIHAENAEILCTTHLKNSIDFELTLIAKHESKEVAEADLKKMKWIYDVSNKKIFLRNYIELSRNETKPESNIKVIYRIKVPESCAVEISNYFGRTDVENLNNKLEIKSEFSIIHLQNISAETNINTVFGDVSANGISGHLRVDSRRSDIEISYVSGSLDLHSVLAEINLKKINEANEIKVDAEKSKINIRTEDFNNFKWQLELYMVDLKSPDGMKLNYEKNEKEDIKASFNIKEELPQIEIKVKTGSLTIEH